MTLFRPAAIAARLEPRLGKVILMRPLSFTVVTAFTLVLAFSIVLFLCLGTYTKRTTVSGVVVPEKGLIKVLSPQVGAVLECRVKENQHVAAGDVLFVVSSERLTAADGHGAPGINVESNVIDKISERRESLKTQREEQVALDAALRERAERQIKGFKDELVAQDADIALQTSRLASMQLLFERIAGLHEKHFVSDFDYEQKHAEILDQQSRLKTMQRDRMATQRQIESSTSDLHESAARGRQELARISGQRSELEQSSITASAQSRILVVAPEDGVVTGILVSPGQSTSSTPLLTLLPDHSSLLVELYAPSRSVGFIEIGQPVNIRYESFPYQKFGQYGGHVTGISRAPIAPQELASAYPVGAEVRAAQENMYRIRVLLESESVTAYGRSTQLTPGMLLSADIRQDTRTLLEWILEPLFGLHG